MKGTPIQKKTVEPKFSWFVIASVIFHFGFVLSSALGSGRSSRTDLAMINPFFVSLYQPRDFPGFAGAKGPAPENGSAPAKPAEKAAPPAPAQKASPEKVALPKDSTKEDLKKDTGTTISTGLTDEEKKRVSDAISAIKREVNKGEASGAEAEWQGIVGEINADIEKKAYYQRVVEVYKNSWVVPSSVPVDDPNLRVRVVVRINKQGRTIDYQVLSWSGNQDLNRSVSRLLDLVKELPAPTWDEGTDWISLPLAFTPYQEE